MLAGLQIVEHHNHSVPVSYVPIGLDATVVHGSLDFKFKNNTASYLCLKTEVKEGEFTVKILGYINRKPGVIIEYWVKEVLEPKVVYEKDISFGTGHQEIKQEGQHGYIVHTKRIIKPKDSNTIQEELIVSRYNPIDKVIIVGKSDATAILLSF